MIPFDALQDFWTVNSPLQNTIILLVGQTVVALGGEFKLYLPRIVPQMLRVFMHDNSQGRVVTTKVRCYFGITGMQVFRQFYRKWLDFKKICAG